MSPSVLRHIWFGIQSVKIPASITPKVFRRNVRKCEKAGEMKLKSKLPPNDPTRLALAYSSYGILTDTRVGPSN